MRRVPLLLLLLGLLVPLGIVRATPASAASSGPGVELADPDTVRMSNGHYVTFGTGERVTECNRQVKFTNVAYTVSTTKATPKGTCITGDALPGGAGGWAAKDSPVWAPGVVHGPNGWLMFYAAKNKARSGQMCIGVATASAATGPYAHQRRVLCTDSSKWSIDPNPITFKGKVYVVFRDDSASPDNQEAISIVRTNGYGKVVSGTRHTLLTSDQMTWEAKGAHGQHIVENPALFRAKGGDWMLMFSGDKWASKNYATGIADCGAKLLPLPGPKSKKAVPRCSLAHPDRPYFGYSKAATKPIHTLPLDHPGPGGMDVYNSPQGLRVVWHWWRKVATDTTGDYVSERYIMWGLLKEQKSGFVVKYGLT